jgi:hypothetical protein
MRFRLILALIALSVAPLLAGGEVGYYASGYGNKGYTRNPSPVKKDSASTTYTSETAEQSTAAGSTLKKWGITLALSLPISMDGDFYQYSSSDDNIEFDIIVKRFIETGNRYLTIPIELEASFFWIGGEYEYRSYSSYYGYDYRDREYYESFFELSNNILARFAPLSFFYVEGGIEWGINFSPKGCFTLGIPMGFGFRIADTIEIGERVTIGLTDRNATVGSVTRFQVLSLSVVF